MGANGLRNVLQGYDGGGGFPNYPCGEIVARIIWASEANIHDDELESLLGDVCTFLRRSLGAGLLRRSYRDDGSAMIDLLAKVNAKRSGVRSDYPPVCVLDTSSDPPALWIPRGPLWAYLRDVRNKINSSDARGLLEQVGWQWLDAQRRRPGTEHKPKARVWLVPCDWDAADFDLLAAVNDAPEVES
jgi:hypothetical protein